MVSQAGPCERGAPSRVRDISDVIRHRHSERVPFDPQRPPSREDLQQILEAARWAPMAHNMQNFKVIIVGDKAVRAAIGRVRAGPSSGFVWENFAQLPFREEELIARAPAFRRRCSRRTAWAPILGPWMSRTSSRGSWTPPCAPARL